MYWIDPGLVRAVNNRFGGLHPDEEGTLFEGLIATILRAYREYRDSFDALYYWPAASGSSSEVDFLVEKNGRFTAIEVKYSVNFSGAMLKGLTAVGDLPGLRKRILVYRGSRMLKTEEGILVLPFDDFCKMAATGELTG